MSLVETLRGTWQGFRARSIYAQAQLLVLVAYAGVVVATVALVRPPSQTKRNDLEARITVLPGDPVVGRTFVIENASAKDWVGVRFEIDGGYVAKRDAVLAGEKLTLYQRDFTRVETLKLKKKKVKPVTVTAPASLTPLELRIATSAGTVVYWLGGARSP